MSRALLEEYQMKRLLFAFAWLCCASQVYAQIAAVGTETLLWDQAGASLATVSGYTYQVADGDAATQPLPAVTCTGAASPFVCSARLPALTTGLHSLRLLAQTTVNGQTLVSAWSPPLALLILAVPATPQNVRIGP